MRGKEEKREGGMERVREKNCQGNVGREGGKRMKKERKGRNKTRRKRLKKEMEWKGLRVCIDEPAVLLLSTTTSSSNLMMWGIADDKAAGHNSAFT